MVGPRSPHQKIYRNCPGTRQPALLFHNRCSRAALILAHRLYVLHAFHRVADGAPQAVDPVACICTGLAGPQDSFPTTR